MVHFRIGRTNLISDKKVFKQHFKVHLLEPVWRKCILTRDVVVFFNFEWASSNALGIICPLVEIGLNETPNARAHPALPLMASLQTDCKVVLRVPHSRWGRNKTERGGGIYENLVRTPIYLCK